MGVIKTRLDSVDDKTSEQIEITWSEMADFTIVRRPTVRNAFLQIGVREEVRDAFRLLFDMNGKEQQLRITRVPFGGK